MHIDEFTARFDKVRRVRDGQYTARCPAHDDRNPSLAIAESGDGRILVNCRSGCSALEVISAIGLDWGDLFPETDKEYRSLASFIGVKPKGSADDYVMDISRHQSERLSGDDRARLKKAALSGGEPLGFAETVFKEASRPLPSEYLTSIDSEADFDALKTEAAWHFNEIDKGSR